MWTAVFIFLSFVTWLSTSHLDHTPADHHSLSYPLSLSFSVLGVWVQHGEGRVHFPNAHVRARVLANGQVPLRYVDDEGAATEVYPFNPNGSETGIAGLCSPCGRHTALMPYDAPTISVFLF